MKRRAVNDTTIHRLSARSVLISDRDPDDTRLVASAQDVHSFARTTLKDPNLTADETRFVASQLLAALGDVLSQVECYPEGEDEDA